MDSFVAFFSPYVSGYFLTMLSGTVITLYVAILSLVVGLLLAIVFALLELSSIKFLRWCVVLLVSLIRSLPEIVLIFLIGMGLPFVLVEFMDNPPELSHFMLGTCALSLIFASYASQTLRGALLAVPKSQWDSGVVLGLSKSATFFYIVMPQMWRHAMPGLSNQWLVLLKDTALVSLIGLHELMFASNAAFSATGKPFTWIGLAALIYLAISLVSQQLQKIIYGRLTRYEGEA